MIARELFSDDHELYRQTARRFLEQEVAPHHDQWEEQGYVDRAVWLKAGELGLLCPTMPEAYGGAGVDRLYAVVFMEEIARVNATGLGFGLHSEIVAPYLLHYGTEAQKQHYLPAMARGEIIGAIAMTEPVYVEKVAGTSGNFLSAIRMELEGSEIDFAGENWILEGDTRAIVSDGKRYRVRFDREQLALPFSLHLSKFTVAMDPGTEKAAGYASDVEVRTPAGTAAETAHISMNEPLKHGGYTFYQASYQLRDGEPPISVFSVNLDPGRWVKYLGSILLCLGLGLMFYMNPHYWNKLLGGKKE